MLSKNALWVALSSTLAASCLFTAVMCREATHRPSTSGVETAVDALVAQTSSVVGQQEVAAEGFATGVTAQLSSQTDQVDDNCVGIRDALGLPKEPGEPETEPEQPDGPPSAEGLTYLEWLAQFVAYLESILA